MSAVPPPTANLLILDWPEQRIHTLRTEVAGFV